MKYLKVAAIIGLLFAGIIPLAAIAQSDGRSETYRQLDLFGEVFERVRAEYV